MKHLFKGLAILLVLLNLLIVFSGKSWIYRGASLTYLKGEVSSYIHDFVHFPYNVVEAGNHQAWAISDDYNQASIPDFAQRVNQDLESVAFLVIQNDSVRYEEYWDGYSADTLSNSFSMTKSFVGTLVGTALKDGDIQSLDQKICDFIPEYCNDENADLSIRQVLSMSSGLNWVEDYFNPLGMTAEAYYGSRLREIIMGLSVVEPPGEVFKYKSGNTQLLGYVVEAATGKTLSKYASEKLWNPLGCKNNAKWGTDGTDEKAFCCFNSNARDFARWGKLMLQQGSWNGVQIIDSAFVQQATSIAPLVDKAGRANINYGYQLWITERQGYEVFYARGLWGQYIICIPEKNMVVVRLGRKFGALLSDMHHDDLYTFIDAALEMYP